MARRSVNRRARRLDSDVANMLDRNVNTNYFTITIIVIVVFLALFGLAALLGGDYYGMGSMMGGIATGFMSLIGILFMILFIVALILFIIWLVKQLQYKRIIR